MSDIDIDTSGKLIRAYPRNRNVLIGIDQSTIVTIEGKNLLSSAIHDR